MPTVVIVDDDFALELLVENLKYRGHQVTRFPTQDAALREIEQVAKADVLVLDIIMPRSSSDSAAAVSGGRTTGMTVFAEARRENPTLRILAYTATTDFDTIQILKADPHTTFLAKWSTPSLAEVIAAIERLLGAEHTLPPPQPFIVHGHDAHTKLAVKNYLQNVLKLPEPIILPEQPGVGRTIIEKFEHYAARAELAFVILTPDDAPATPDLNDDSKRRARQNVIFELGYFLGLLGRLSGRVFLLHKGPLDLPSDIAGLIYVDISNGVEAAGEQLRKEIEHAR